MKTITALFYGLVSELLRCESWFSFECLLACNPRMHSNELGEKTQYNQKKKKNYFNLLKNKKFIRLSCC